MVEETVEKRLTDEEIVKALECCATDKIAEVRCPECILEEENGCCTVLLLNALDLIRRLQDENKRLSEEHERIAWSKQEYMDWVHGFLYTHTDMKDRGEKFEAFDRDWMCNVFWEEIVGALEYIIDLEKQVDEYFKKAYFYYQRCKMYGIEFFYDDEFESKPAKEGKTITFPKFKEDDEVK